MKKHVLLLAFFVVLCFGICGCSRVESMENKETENDMMKSESGMVERESDIAENVNDIAESENDIIPLDKSAFPEYQQDLIGLSEAFYIAHINITSELSEEDKADFFRFIISGWPYQEKAEEWKVGEEYIIPLADIEDVIFTHPDTSDFDPAEGFLEAQGNYWYWGYDEEKQAYITNDLGGYGGAAALGVLKCEENDGRLNIVLGSYDMNKYYSSERTYELVGTYEVDYLTQGEPNDFKVLRTEYHEVQ